MVRCHIVIVMTVVLLIGHAAVSQSMEVDVAAVTALVKNWNAGHSPGNVGDLCDLYSDTVDYYGARMMRHECISRKRSQLERQSNFNQVITKDLLLSAYQNGLIRCDISIEVTNANSTVDRALYLLVKLVDDEYAIVGERDLATDRKDPHPYFGSKVSIKDVPHFQDKTHKKSLSLIIDLIVFVVPVAVAVFAIRFVFRRQRVGQRTETKKRPRRSAGGLPRTLRSTTGNFSPNFATESGVDFHGMGYAFEKYVVKKFDRRFFTLLDWRSDKFHDGIYAQSIRDPDLVYEFRFSNTVRKFSVECKYRSKTINDSVWLMDESKYQAYERYHRNTMPVYVALGLGGTPDDPAKLYLIPFANVALEMHLLDLAPYRKARTEFFYDLENDRLR